MITQVYQKDFQRFLSLPVLGPWMDSYAAWLHEHQYTRRSSRYELRMAARVSKFLRGKGYRKVRISAKPIYKGVISGSAGSSPRKKAAFEL